MKIEVIVQDEVLQFKQMPNFKDGTYTIEIKNMENRSNQQSRSLYLDDNDKQHFKQAQHNNDTSIKT